MVFLWRKYFISTQKSRDKNFSFYAQHYSTYSIEITNDWYIHSFWDLLSLKKWITFNLWILLGDCLLCLFQSHGGSRRESHLIRVRICLREKKKLPLLFTRKSGAVFTTILKVPFNVAYKYYPLRGFLKGVKILLEILIRSEFLLKAASYANSGKYTKKRRIHKLNTQIIIVS